MKILYFVHAFLFNWLLTSSFYDLPFNCFLATFTTGAVDRRLLDYDDKVRGQAVSVLCDLVKCRIRHVQPDIVSHIQDRLRDKKVISCCGCCI